MTAGIILVISILVLGGVIATVSDRLGTKVGKARLSLFNLRPRNTAMVVTILTGSVLSALTLGILFASSKPLRRGVFQIDQIQTRLNNARKDLTRAEDEKKRAEKDLARAKTEINTAMAQLNTINQSLQIAQSEAIRTSKELEKTQNQLGDLQKKLREIQVARTATEAELKNREDRLQVVFQQKQSLQSEIQKLRTERRNLIQQQEQVKAQIRNRDQEIAERDQEIGKRDQEMKEQDRELEQQEKRITEQDQIIAKRESRLEELEIEQKNLEQQKKVLSQQVELIGRDFQLLREGSVVLERGQVLSSGLVRISDPTTSIQAVNTLLKEANNYAIESVQLGNIKVDQARVIQITKAEVEDLINQIDDGRDYVVQVISAANYLVGETKVSVFTKAEPNRLLFNTGEVIAGTTLNPSTLSHDQLRKQMQQLLDASSFRARFVGVVGGTVQIGNDRMDTLIRFFQQVQDHSQPLEIQAIAAEDAYTIGPLRLDLLALRNGEVIFSTRQQEQLNDSNKLQNPSTEIQNIIKNLTSQSDYIQ